MAAFAAAISEHPDPAHAVGEVVGAVVEACGVGPDLAFVFISGHAPDTASEIAAAVRTLLGPGVLVGSTAAVAIGGDFEAEEGCAISLWAGRIGPVEAVRLETLRGPEGTAVAGMPDDAAFAPRTLVLLTEAYSFPVDALTQAANAQYPGLTIVGGVASAPGGPGTNRLVLDGAVHGDGAVGVLLPPGLGEFAVVSQGCRPIGSPLTVTESDGNLVQELGSRPALERLREVYDAADEHDQQLMGRSLHVGLVVDETSVDFAQGDFLVRGVLGADQTAGALRVGDRVDVGSTVQFHVRDGDTARVDLADLLRSVDADAALLFSCTGRGHRLFGNPDHDARGVSAAVSGGAVAGMFCAGQLGPVSGHNHVHGSCASILFFYG